MHRPDRMPVGAGRVFWPTNASLPRPTRDMAGSRGPLRVLIIASHAGSLRNFRGALIEDIQSLGHEVHACAPGLGDDEATHGWLRDRGVICHDIPLARTGLNPGADLRALVALIRLMRRIGPDTVLAYTIKPVIWGMLAGWMAGVPNRVALITGLGYAFVGEAQGNRAVIHGLAKRLYTLALRRAGLVIFQNPDDRDDFIRWAIVPAILRR